MNTITIQLSVIIQTVIPLDIIVGNEASSGRNNEDF